MVRYKEDMGNISVIVLFISTTLVVVALRRPSQVFRFQKDQHEDNEFNFS